MSFIHEIYAHYYEWSHYLGDSFPVFQHSFLNIVLFMLLFTLFQFWQNRRKDYRYYSLYLFVNWIYFSTAFGPYFSPIFSNVEAYLAFRDFLRPPGGGGFDDQTEFMLSNLMMICYLLFVKDYFDWQKAEQKAYRVIDWTVSILGIMTLGQLLALFILGKEYHLLGPIELLVKVFYTLPSLWLMYKILRLQLSGSSYIVLGSGALIMGSVVVGVLHGLGDTTMGKRVFLQFGVLIEILFFSAAMGKKDKTIRRQLSEADARNKKERTRLERKFWNLITSQSQKDKTKVEEEISFPEQLQQALEDSYDRESFSVVELAALMQLPEHKLLREVKKHYHKTTKSYILDFRIEKAKTLMQDTSLSLSEIANRVGMGNYAHFSKTFRRKEGCSPRAFREQLKV